MGGVGYRLLRHLAVVKPLWQSGLPHFHVISFSDIKPWNRQTLAVGSDCLLIVCLQPGHPESAKTWFMFDKGFHSNRPNDKLETLNDFTLLLRRSPVEGSHHPVYTCMPCVSCVTGALTPERPVGTALNSHDGSHRDWATRVCIQKSVSVCQEARQNHSVLPEKPEACLTPTVKWIPSVGALEKPRNWPQTSRKTCILTGRNLEQEEAHLFDKKGR